MSVQKKKEYCLPFPTIYLGDGIGMHVKQFSLFSAVNHEMPVARGNMILGGSPLVRTTFKSNDPSTPDTKTEISPFLSVAAMLSYLCNLLYKFSIF